MKQPPVYNMANKRNGTLYTGVTSSILHRISQHREGLIDGFTKRYGCKLLVWFELHSTMHDAISREKQIKGGSRAKKLALIEEINPDIPDWLIAIISRLLRKHPEERYQSAAFVAELLGKGLAHLQHPSAES